MRMRVAILAGVLAVVAASLAITMPARQGSACCDTIYAITSSNLLRFDSATPGTIDSTTPITGLQAAESIFAIDFRPATGQLYGIGSTGQLYTIDTTTAAATPVGASVRGRRRIRNEYGLQPDRRSHPGCERRGRELPAQPRHRCSRRHRHQPCLRCRRHECRSESGRAGDRLHEQLRRRGYDNPVRDRQHPEHSRPAGRR